MSISIGPGIVVGRRGIRLSGGAAATPWWLSGGISAANAVAVYQPIGAASLAASYVNLANPGTYDAAPGVAPTFDAATGWTFNGSTQYLTAAVTPNVDRTWSAVVRFADVVGSNGALLGWAYTAAYQMLPRFNAETQRLYSNGATTSLVVTGAVTAGVMAIAGLTGYLDGVSDGAIASSPGGEMGPLYVGARNSNGVTGNYCAGKIQAVAIYNATLTADQVAAVSTAMAAL